MKHNEGVTTRPEIVHEWLDALHARHVATYRPKEFTHALQALSVRYVERRKELGIRAAVGATRADLARLVLRESLAMSLAGAAACLGLGLVHIGGQGSIAWAMGRLPAALASVVVLVQPVVAAYAGWLLFGEALGPLQVAGAAVALSGVVLAQWAARTRATPQTP